MKAKAVRFLRDVLADDARGDEVEDESPEDYAKRKHITITNPKRKNTTMATKKELEQEIADLEAENDALQNKLDKIADLTADEEDDEDEEDDD